ncbi:hypothetical protein ACJQWK_11737 [Exserohilum turcicum]
MQRRRRLVRTQADGYSIIQTVASCLWPGQASQSCQATPIASGPGGRVPRVVRRACLVGFFAAGSSCGIQSGPVQSIQSIQAIQAIQAIQSHPIHPIPPTKPPMTSGRRFRGGRHTTTAMLSSSSSSSTCTTPTSTSLAPSRSAAAV